MGAQPSLRTGQRSAETGAVATAIRQLEWADVYLVAAQNVEFLDADVAADIALIRRQLRGLKQRLLRPRLLR